MASTLHAVSSTRRPVQKVPNTAPKFKIPENIIRFLQVLALSVKPESLEQGARLTPKVYLPTKMWDFVSDSRTARRITGRVDLLSELAHLAAGSELTPAKLKALEIQISELKPILVEKRTISQRLLFKKAPPIKPQVQQESRPLMLRKRSSSLSMVSRIRSSPSSISRRSSDTNSVSTRTTSTSSSSEGEQTSIRQYGESIGFLADMVASADFRIGSQQLLVLVTEKLFPLLVDDIFAILQAYSGQVQKAHGL